MWHLLQVTRWRGALPCVYKSDKRVFLYALPDCFTPGEYIVLPGVAPKIPCPSSSEDPNADDHFRGVSGGVSSCSIHNPFRPAGDSPRPLLTLTGESGRERRIFFLSGDPVLSPFACRSYVGVGGEGRLKLRLSFSATAGDAEKATGAVCPFAWGLGRTLIFGSSLVGVAVVALGVRACRRDEGARDWRLLEGSGESGRAEASTITSCISFCCSSAVDGPADAPSLKASRAERSCTRRLSRRGAALTVPFTEADACPL